MSAETFQRRLRETKRKAFLQGASRTLDLGATSSYYLVSTSQTAITKSIHKDARRVAGDMWRAVERSNTQSGLLLTRAKKK